MCSDDGPHPSPTRLSPVSHPSLVPLPPSPLSTVELVSGAAQFSYKDKQCPLGMSLLLVSSLPVAPAGQGVNCVFDSGGVLLEALGRWHRHTAGSLAAAGFHIRWFHRLFVKRRLKPEAPLVTGSDRQTGF
ncbi:unnamed protein product [Pleuronectes platessa]|uniref:Uncharacterized protein n=1 Tax=Pleuronectes platessa TaxID=8262 RepID=A0A9N7TJ28_PLEPL|nr:unnamed protein product [Pleuronectes platessa]